jgi:membrane protein DedA with SNARE-associated domain
MPPIVVVPVACDGPQRKRSTGIWNLAWRATTRFPPIFIGTAALGAAVAAASQDRLNLATVIVLAVIAGEAGGLGGYAIGRRWGRRLLDRPGRYPARREKILDRGERVYARWGA